jgi:subtilisin family serine protease
MKLRGLKIAGCLAILVVFASPAFAPPAAKFSPVTRSADGMVTHNPINPKLAPLSPYRQVLGEILVRFRESAPKSTRTFLHATLGTKVIKEFKSVKGLQLVKLSAGMTMSKALQAFGKAPEVLYAEPNYIVNTFATPNDTCYPELWGMNNIGQTGGTADADIDAPEAWNLTTGTTNVVVAVIDTGVDYTHPDLAANMFQDPVDGSYGINVVSGTTDPMDDNGHGTHVSGIIGAVGNNSLGVVGVNWNVQILACKFLDATGTGTNAGAIACLDYVASMKDRGFKIVATNNSYGGGAYSQALHDAIDAQRQRGILFIAAAGNFRSDNETLQTYPASYSLPNILSIASTDASDNLSFFSNYGKRVVHIAAPGENILSTVPGGYEFYNGTSMATPHVTGVAALIHAL